MSGESFRWRVAWRHPKTGEIKKGQPLEKGAADAWVQKLNREYPFLDHFAVIVSRVEERELQEAKA